MAGQRKHKTSRKPGSKPSPGLGRHQTGLRQRKKAKTKATIQRQALRLFRKWGYDATTVEQIAAAAEVSPSTFFRYFPAKEDVVLWDDLDPLLLAAFKAQPAKVSPIRALRAAMRQVFEDLPPAVIEEQRQRTRLILSVPGLRARMLEQFSDLVQMLAGVVAERSGRDVNDFAVHNLSGAMIGVLMSTLLAAAEEPWDDVIKMIDASLEHLEEGLPL